MRKLIVSEWVSLDGVVQAPASADEDRSNGFTHGGWHPRYFDDASMKWTLDNVSEAGGYLFGRRTYEIFAAHWPNASEEEQELAEPLNTRPKYVASTTLTEPLSWEHSKLLAGDIAHAVNALKKQPGGDLLVIGSTKLVHTLMELNLVDELRLTIDPVVVGGGKRIFADGGKLRSLQLLNTQVVKTGAILATYKLERVTASR